MRARSLQLIALVSLLPLALSAEAEIYSYTNAEGDYVVSQKRPDNPEISYAVLTDDGEFIRMVEGRGKQVPITHWRPFFLPKEPHPFDGPEVQPQEQDPVISIDEVEQAN